MILIQDGKRYDEIKFALEADFEQEVVESQESIFGKDTIFIDAKKKIGTGALGNTIPDGFLFDLSEPDNHEFYIVEVELEKHHFYNHIFPQITKFFAFFKNSQRQKELVEKLFSAINSDATLKKKFKKYLGEEEIFKFLNDLIDTSQNILLILDGKKRELPEITDTYSDTWGKMVRVIEIKKFKSQSDVILSVDPEFENIAFAYEEPGTDGVGEGVQYDENYHLEGVSEAVKEVYSHLRSVMEATDDSFVFNTQKYYVSIKGKKNVAFIKVRKKKLRIVVMLPEDQIREVIGKHEVKSLSQSVQNFYNGPCAAVDVGAMDDIDEIETLIRKAMQSGNVPADPEAYDASGE